MTKLRETLLAEDRELSASYERNAPKRKLALALRSLRKDAGLTQEQVAARSGLTQSHVSKMESATGPMPTTESLNRYADACGSDLCLSFPKKGAMSDKLRRESGLVSAVF